MNEFQPISLEIDRIANKIVDAAFQVHVNLGPGLLESVYEECLSYELSKKKMNARRQVPVPIYYDGVLLASELRLDLLIEEEIIVELKSIDVLRPIHDAQLLTYLKLTHHRLGFLINFNVPRIKDGIKRIVI